MVRRRSHNPERIRSQRLDDLVVALSAMDDEELAVARNLAVHEHARRHEFRDEAARSYDEQWVCAQLAVSEADLRCREQTGNGLRTVADYREHAEPGTLSSSALLKLFDGWGNVLGECGLLAVAQPEAELTLRPGSPAKSRRWQDEDFVVAVAMVFERFRGRLMSQGAYEKACEVMPVEMPTTNMMRNAYGGANAQGFWDDIRERARAHILANPARYPRASAYLLRQQEVR
jgi:hypothetical protein